MEVRLGEVEVRLLVHRQRGTDVEQHDLEDPIGEVDAHLVRDPRAAVVPADVEGLVAELVHDGDEVAGHSALRIGFDGAGAGGLGGLAIAAKVRDHEGVVVEELGGDSVPDVSALWEAVEEEESWARRIGVATFEAVDVYLRVILGGECERLQTLEHVAFIRWCRSEDGLTPYIGLVKGEAIGPEVGTLMRLAHG